MNTTRSSSGMIPIIMPQKIRSRNVTTRNSTICALSLISSQQQGELLIIDEEVDPYLEIAEIHRRVIAKQGPALLFTQGKRLRLFR